ncbi:MAG TPA: phosphate ABC transporter substrate-binding protein PstS [Longimicrobiaceae bacterium]|nr:phosphate ABC transporter substrate-binding protein PstS [Longimicrobiaceae bacterium]
MIKHLRRTSVSIAAMVALAACGGNDRGATPGAMTQQQAAAPEGTLTLVGAGSTFDYPVFSRWFADYAKQHPVRVNYQSIGSGGGIRQFTQGTVDFGASDAPLTPEEQAKVPGAMNLPVILGSVGITYNLPSVRRPLKLTGDVLARIYLGEITKWNDPALAALNPGVSLPGRDILVVHRSDGSGTTYIFSDYLSAVSAVWKQKVGTGKSLSWPAGLGAKGNEGVTGQVKQTEGGVGYVEQAYAEENHLPMAQMKNAGGRFVAPSVASTRVAAAGLAQQIQQHPDFKLSIVNAPGADAYPIAAWSYLVVHQQMADCAKAKALVDLFSWSLTEGDAAAEQLHYAPLPENVQAQVLEKLQGITCGPDRQPVGRR